MDSVHFGDALQHEVSDLTKSFTRYSRNGFTFKEYIRFVFECMDSMSSLGLQFTDISHEEQKREVVDVLRLLLQKIDIPLIMEPFESGLKFMLFTYVIPELFTVMVKSKMSLLAAKEPHNASESRQDHDENA